MMPVRTLSANATSATGGANPSRGLRARNASAKQENTAAQTAVIAASIREGFAGAGAIWILAASPTCDAACPM